ncbi:MAG: DUF4398 domain-containing protein, partial [Burkholderiales bacterium]|nr:DUF4398 domain-containing protein [Burkholderiales bacterium]
AHAASAGSAEAAPADLASARDKLGRAEVALAAHDNDTALALAQQSQADAQLAAAKTEAMRAQRSAQALDASARALREEMARKAP